YDRALQITIRFFISSRRRHTRCYRDWSSDVCSSDLHKMTGLPAARLCLRDRGVVRPGARADLVVFDARRVADRATYEDPHRYPEGIEHVVVNGRFVVKHGEHTGSLPGKVLTPP